MFPYPTTLTLLNLLVGSVMASLMWITGFQDRPKLTKKTLLAIAPLAVVHTIGNLLTNISLGKVRAAARSFLTNVCDQCRALVVRWLKLWDAWFERDVADVQVRGWCNGRSQRMRGHS